MTIYERHDISDLYDLRDLCWSGALDRIDDAIDNEIDGEFFDYIIENVDGWGDIVELTEVNDFIWFECDDWLEEHKQKEEDEDEEE